MRILIHTYFPVYPYSDGAGHRIFNMTPYFTERHTCDLIQERWPWESQVQPLSPACPPDWLERRYRHVWNIHHLTNEKLLYGFVWQSPAMQKLINNVLVKGAYDIVWSGNDTLPVYLSPSHLANTPILINPTDSMHLQYHRVLRQQIAYQRKLRILVKWGLYSLYQMRFMNRIPNWTMVAERDAQDMHLLSPRINIKVIPNGVDIDRYTSETALHNPYEAVFVGTLGESGTNEIAVIWFLKNVWLKVIKSIPEASIKIVGRGPSAGLVAFSKELDNVTVTGFVKDPCPYLWQAGIFVLPMRSGAGIKNKLLESWAAGCAVVTNSLGIEGMKHAQHGENVMVADDPEQMAETLIGLMNNPLQQRELGEHGQVTARRWYAWDGIAAQVESELISIVETRKHSKGGGQE